MIESKSILHSIDKTLRFMVIHSQAKMAMLGCLSSRKFTSRLRLCSLIDGYDQIMR